MTEIMWETFGQDVITLAGYAVTAALLIFGLKAGINVGKDIWARITGNEIEYDYNAPGEF